MIKIVLTGPESVGKSTLCKELAKYFNTICISEYARNYIEKLNRKYTYNDVINIAKTQIKQFEQEYFNANKFIFFDTDLKITKIWFEEVYNKVPDFVANKIKTNKPDMHLLCFPDIKWEKDAVRENEEARLYLYEKYKNEIEKNNINYNIITGTGSERLNLALKKISSAYSLQFIK